MISRSFDQAGETPVSHTAGRFTMARHPPPGTGVAASAVEAELVPGAQADCCRLMSQSETPTVQVGASINNIRKGMR